MNIHIRTLYSAIAQFLLNLASHMKSEFVYTNFHHMSHNNIH